jgi:hypothetical protein
MLEYGGRKKYFKVVALNGLIRLVNQTYLQSSYLMALLLSSDFRDELQPDTGWFQGPPLFKTLW